MIKKIKNRGPNIEILALAIPNIISNVSVPLISSVDTGLMGRLSASHVAAVGVSSMMFNLLYWNFGFLRMGTTGLTAQAHGAENIQETGNILIRAITLALLIGLLFITFSGGLLSAGSYLMNVDSSYTQMVNDYFFTRIWAAPASLMLICLMGWFFGRQNAIYPLIITVVVNIVNVASSIYFVEVMGMEVRGVALGTVISQYTGLVLAFALLAFHYREDIKAVVMKQALELGEYTKFLRINSDIFIRTFCLTFVFGFFYSQSSAAGELVLASNVILMQFVNWMSYGIDGFAYASEALTGKYKGMKNNDKLNTIIKLSFVWGTAVALLYTFAYSVFGTQILGVFTTDAELFDFTEPLLVWVVIIPIFGFASYIWDGIYIGLVASKSMRNAMLLSLLVFIGFYYFLPELEHHQELWIALISFLVARAVFQSTLYFRHGTELK